MGRAIRRGLQKMRIQAFLTAVAFNLKLLATAVAALLVPLLALTRWPIDCSDNGIQRGMTLRRQYERIFRQSY
jgi:hypothetical protein